MSYDTTITRTVTNTPNYDIITSCEYDPVDEEIECEDDYELKDYWTKYFKHNFGEVSDEQLEYILNDKENLHKSKREIIEIYNRSINKNYLELESINDQIASMNKILDERRLKYDKENMVSTNLSIFIFVFVISSLIYIISYTFFTEKTVKNFVNGLNSY
jgi:hypothetical protein